MADWQKQRRERQTRLAKSLADPLAPHLQSDADPPDRRDEIGLARKGRPQVAAIARRMMAEAAAHG
jgi:hypothetical protein